MSRGVFVKPDLRATASAVLSASSEVGLTVGTPVAGTSNLGGMRLRGSCLTTPTAATNVDIVLQSGGLANGPYSRMTSLAGYTGAPGATVRYRDDGGSSTSWRGHTDPTYLTYARMIKVGSALIDYPQVSECRTLGNGNLGRVFIQDSLGSITVVFGYKASRVAAWSQVSIASVGSSTSSRPGWVVLPSGRIIVFAWVDASLGVDAFYSDDHGVTWATWSTTTGITGTVATAFRTICAEVSGDSICIVTGGSEAGTSALKVHWSIDVGQTFSTTYSGSNCYAIRTAVSATGQVFLAYSDGSNGSTVPVLFGGGIGAEAHSGPTVNTSASTFALATLDDGTIWLIDNATNAEPTTALKHTVSLDNGATWVTLSDDTSVFNNQTFSGTKRGPIQIVAGTYDGALVLICRTDVATAAVDNGAVEYWLGGWDTLTETNTHNSDGETGTYPYGSANGVSVGPEELLENLGWTKTDTGAGATVTQTADGINIVATGANNSYYTYAWVPQTGDGWRFRFVMRINSGGSLASDACYLAFYASDGVNRQWVKIRFISNQFRIIDNSGTLATITPASMTAKFMEFFIAFNHDNPAGAGLCSIYYRSEASGAHGEWNTAIANQAIAEEAGVATEAIVVGGSAAVATDWDFVYLGVAEGGKWASGFTNPTNLHGRPLSSAVDFVVKNGVRLGAFGGPGVVGDSYDLATTYQYAARNIWVTPRLPSRWEAVDGTAQNTVLYSGNLWRVGAVTLHGTNYRAATLQLHSSDSWGAPSYSVAMNAEVWAGSVATNATGLVLVDGRPFTPHRFRSTKGRRWFLYVTASGATYEIADNDEDALYVAGLTGLAPGAGISIYGDRMGAILPTAQSYAYLRLVITSQTVSDSNYRTGLVVAAPTHEIEIPYDSGFVDRYPASVTVTETTSGHVHTGVLGSEHPEVRIAWGLIDRLSSTYMERVSMLFRSLDGENYPLVFWRDVNDVSTLGLYRASGPVTRENAYGELSDAFDRLAEMRLREETT